MALPLSGPLLSSLALLALVSSGGALPPSPGDAQHLRGGRSLLGSRIQKAPPGVPSFNRGVLGNTSVAPGAIGTTERLRHARGNTVVASISVGTPPQRMSCLVDSGSSDLWIPSRRCATCENAHHFVAEKSSTFAPRVRRARDGSTRPLAVHITYGSGEIVGFEVQDTVRLGSVSLPNQSFVIVEDAALPPHRSWDGICGLGWKHLASAGQPLYQHLQALGGKAVFSLVPAGGHGASYISVGSHDAEASCRPGTLVWSPAEALGPAGERSFWVVTGGLAIHRRDPVRVRYLVDTGTTFLLVPPRVYRPLVGSVFPARVFEQMCGIDSAAGSLVVCDCAVVGAPGMLPLRVQLAGREFVLPVEKLFKRVQATDGGQELCLLQVQENPMAPQQMPASIPDILGGPMGLGGLLGGLPFGGPMGGMPFAPGTEPEAGPGTDVGSGAPADGPPGQPFPWLGPGMSPPSSGAAPPFPLPLPFPFPSPFGAGGAQDPFAMPDATDGAAGPPGLGGDGLPQAGERIERIITTRPDGAVCTHSLVWEGDRLKHNQTECREAGRGGQSLPPAWTSGNNIGLPTAWPSSDDPELAKLLGGGRRLQLLHGDPEDELWILGGVFLEHFVAIFDFDEERIGFCEPSEAAGPSQAGSNWAAEPPAGSAPAGGWPDAAGSVSGHMMVGSEDTPAVASPRGQLIAQGHPGLIAIALALLGVIVASPFFVCGGLRHEAPHADEVPLVRAMSAVDDAIVE